MFNSADSPQRAPPCPEWRKCQSIRLFRLNGNWTNGGACWSIWRPTTATAALKWIPSPMLAKTADCEASAAFGSLSMIADSAARLEALDVSQSFIVQAPAGSGKTELLIQRYLKLLATVETPDAVVAITFTRKAAGEMRSRVITALQTAQRGIEPVAEHERVTFQIARHVLEHERRLEWNLLQNPARLRIETIDALCASITRRMPWLSRFGAMPEIIEKAEGLYREAARNTLSHLEEGHDGLAYLLLHLDNDFQRAKQLITQMLATRDHWLRYIGIPREDLEGSLQRIVSNELEQLRGAFDDDAAVELPEARLEDLGNWM